MHIEAIIPKSPNLFIYNNCSAIAEKFSFGLA